MRIVVIVQARCGSTRLPGKILKQILGKTVLFRQMERMTRAEIPDDFVVATTEKSGDDAIAEICRNEGFKFFRGDEDDLLDRHFKAAKEFSADVAVKIPSDCPLIDPKVIDKVLEFYLENRDRFDFVSNLHPPTYPDGNDVEIVPAPILEKAWKEARKNYEREHTTPYIWDHPDKFRIGNYKWESGLDYSMTHRFTIDYQEDYDFIKKVYEELYPKNKYFDLNDILNLLQEKPEIYKINSDFAGVNWYRDYVENLSTIDESGTKRI